MTMDLSYHVLSFGTRDLAKYCSQTGEDCIGTRLGIEIFLEKFLPKPLSPSEAVEVRHDADARRDVVRCPGLAVSSASRL